MASKAGAWPAWLALLALLLIAAAVWPVGVFGFLLPSDANVGAGSEWVYRSNFGRTVVRMLERDDVRPDFGRYTWDMQVAGLRYAEALELTPDALGVSSRTVAGYGLVQERFHFAEPELVLELPLVVGNTWSWAGAVELGGSSAAAHVRGEVVARTLLTVPAGTFDTFHIRLVRADNFGTRQTIDLWFDPDVGPIRAVGDLRWRGLIGLVQTLVGLRRFEVELVSYEISPWHN